MKLLTQNEQHTLHHRYIQSDLYRQWSPILAILQREYDEADAQTLWYLAEQQIARLRGEMAYREQSISPIYNELLLECGDFNGKTRSKDQARRTASTIMCITLTMLMNAVEEGHEDENFDNEPMCMAILDILSGDTFFQSLMDLFFKRNIGYDGKKVIITTSDPMLEKTLLDSMDEVAKEDIKQMVENVMNRTQGLKVLFKEDWNSWKSLWQNILADTKMMFLIKKEEPRSTDWGINQKMICNVVGAFKDKTKLNVSVKALNDALCSKNIRSYISNHADYNGTDSVLSREQHDRIMHLIEKCVLSKEDN